MTKRLTEQNFKEIIKKMFEIAWIEFISLEDLNKDTQWFTNNTYTQEQEDEFKERLREYLKDYVPKVMLDKQVNHFLLQWWLKVKEK